MTYPLEILHEEKLGQAPKGDIVFVHGICHDARCWKNFIDFFSAQGYPCSALSLRGHGGSGGRKHFRLFTLANYVENVERAVAQCDTKPFLIGHSMGGAAVQQYL
ncbi:alpha/beta hydrolase, partial [Oscillibacter sp. CU971]|uniref:alpha/beta hydrolase n=1 Tax=Oscillibacter sp. CU971 TaxID=2780102 RepID=UPI00195821B4